MKLAEALLLRSEYQKKIENLQSRIMANLKIQEGDVPNENPDELLKEFFLINDKLSLLIKDINIRNNVAILSDGQSLSQALIDRENILKKRNFLAKLVEKSNDRSFRLARSEIKMYTSLSIAEIQKEIDRLSCNFRKLDTKIQSLNWNIDL
ncbi:DIP1984 family protein [Fusobacterium sp. PH5-44]|uniref:DIP1984 family protein n=1 Tax=unclassified Fusobacterium TaxID=2648384 RepID=UPI003D1C2A5D